MAVASGSRLEWTLTAVIAIALTLFCLLTVQPDKTGFYHDDGIYVSTARALAEGEGYRLINLPTEPLATKYPPGYPLLLSAVWWISPEFPQHLHALKAVNCVLAGMLVVCSMLFLQAVVPQSPTYRLAALLLVATAPAVVSFSDLLLSEPLYTVLSIAALAVAMACDEGAGVRRYLLVGCLAAGAMLTRTIGVTLCLALAAWCLAQNRRGGVVAILPMALAGGLWAATVAQAETGRSVLLDYYLVYETSAWRLLTSDPAVAAQIIATNVRVLGTEVSLVFGVGPAWLAATVTALALTGAWSVRREPAGRLVILYVALYCLVVIGHPYPMARYLAPLAPIVFGLLAVAGVRAQALLGVAPLVACGLVLAVHVAWLAHYSSMSRYAVHGEFGRPFVFVWDGFQDTAAWIRENTPATAVLASGHDTFYAMYTGRHAVRPWVHDVHSYRIGEPSLGRLDGSQLLAELRRLGVTYLIEAPLLSGPEGDYGRENIARVLRAAGDPQPIFRTRSGSHAIYEIAE